MTPFIGFVSPTAIKFIAQGWSSDLPWEKIKKPSLKEMNKTMIIGYC